MKRLELARVRICNRCGRGRAELRSGGGELLVVPLDPIRARQLRETPADVRSLTDLVLEQLRANGLEPGEVVLDVVDGKLHSLLSVARADEHEVVACTADEGVALAVRGGLQLYATDEALAHAAARAGRAEPRGGQGPDTIH